MAWNGIARRFLLFTILVTVLDHISRKAGYDTSIEIPPTFLVLHPTISILVDLGLSLPPSPTPDSINFYS